MSPTPEPRVARRVLIAEENAHIGAGHNAVRFAQLAEGYVELGIEVEVLTAWGWAAAAEHRDAPFPVHRFGAAARQFRRLAGRLRALGTETGFRRLANHAGDGLAIVTLAAATRAQGRKMSGPPDLTVVFGKHTEPALLAATVGGGRWLLNQFRTVDETPKWDSSVFRASTRAAARRAERRRRRAGGGFRLAAATTERRDEWAAVIPFLDPIALPIAGTRALVADPDARLRLGLPRDRKVALLFGGSHSKHPVTVVDAFARLDDWTLVVAGRVADELELEPDGTQLVVIPGYLDDSSRDALLMSVDAIVLSFIRGYQPNSGTLMDAISAGVPVVCSAESAAGEIVAEFHLGTLFEPGDAESLADAVRRLPAVIDPPDLAEARAAHSNRAVALGQLHALGLTAPDQTG